MLLILHTNKYLKLLCATTWVGCPFSAINQVWALLPLHTLHIIKVTNEYTADY